MIATAKQNTEERTRHDRRRKAVNPALDLLNRDGAIYFSLVSGQVGFGHFWIDLNLIGQ